MKKFIVLICSFVLALGILVSCGKTDTNEKDMSASNDDTMLVENINTEYVLGTFSDEADPEADVTVIEGIVAASRLHAAFRDTQVTERAVNEEYRLDFDDPEILVDLSKRNSRNTHGVNFNRATGTIEDGVLICQANGTNANGSYDPQIKFAGLEVQAKDYNKIKFRMKRDALPNLNDAKRAESVEIFFATNVSQGFSGSKQINIKLPEDKDLSEWFEIEFDLGNHAEWKDIITDVRFDPTNNNGIYYLDYIVFSKSENIDNARWYDMYVDYAIDNAIISKEEYVTSEYSTGITRKDLFCLLAKAVPGDKLTAINDIKGIPDISKNEKYADVYLMFYNAGIVLGADEKGNFLPDSQIKIGEMREIIKRISIADKRLRGTVACDWSEDGEKFDIEFYDAKDIDRLKLLDVSGEVKGGSLVFGTKKSLLPATCGFEIDNVSIMAEDYVKLRVRVKAEFLQEVEKPEYCFYFKSANDKDFSDKKIFKGDFTSQTDIDPAGWYILTADLPTHYEWTGKIDAFKFVLPDADATYAVDYIRLVPNDPLYGASHNKLLREGYVSHGMLQDIGFERGFFVQHYEQKNVNDEDRNWQYTDTDQAPLWDLGPWWNGIDLWENRDMTTGKYVLTDTKGVNTLIYNPEEKSLSMRVNATKIYNGEPHDVKTYNWWPHLLLNQQYSKYPVDKEKNSAAADRIFVELDMRITDYKDTINKEGANSCQFPLYLYFITDKAPSEKIWFGLSLMNGTSANPGTKPGWAPDSAAHQYMYSIPQATVYDGMLNSFNPVKGVLIANGDWKHIRVDITPHIERCIEWANRDDAYGVEVTKEDMYFGGCNIGFEIHGNYDCTIEIKNLDIIAYNKAD